MNKLLVSWLPLFIILFLVPGCSPKSGEMHFDKIPVNKSGVKFTNTITETDQLNLVTNEYTYMGGGVGIGDFNNDGLQDIFFSANQTSNKLYINEGDFKFKDITQSAGLTSH